MFLLGITMVVQYQCGFFFISHMSVNSPNTFGYYTFYEYNKIDINFSSINY